MKPGFILINNAEFVQIGDEETKKTDEEFKTLNCGYLANIRTCQKVSI
jgi:hypothetical protein